MIAWAVLDATGQIPIGLGQGRGAPEGAVLLPQGLSVMSAARMMMREGEWVDRPQLPGPSVEDGAEGLVLSWDELPEGSQLVVRDGETFEVLVEIQDQAGELICTLGDPGPYLLELSGPVPWKDFEGRVVV